MSMWSMWTTIKSSKMHVFGLQKKKGKKLKKY